MSTDYRRHRLDGLEPGNLLAFLALLGLLRALEEAAAPARGCRRSHGPSASPRCDRC